jgi:hypothetical protein
MATEVSSAAPRLASLPERFGAAWNRFWFTPADAFSLAVLRVLTGLMAVYGLATLTPDLVRFFGPGGLVPVDVIRSMRAAGPDSPFPSTAISFLELIASPGELYAIHAAALIVAVMFTLGIYSRVTGVLLFIAVLAYVHRGPMLATPMEHVLTMALMYLCWSPCGEFLSVDAWRRRRRGPVAVVETAERRGRASVIANVALRLIQVHLTIVYLMMALAKINDGVAADAGEYHAWWMGEAVWWLAARPGAPMADLSGILGSSSVLVNLWTMAIVAFELGFAIFVWVPATRPLVLAIAAPMWLSLAVITGLAPFCLMMLIGNLAFFQPETLRSWAGRFGPLRAAGK